MTWPLTTNVASRGNHDKRQQTTEGRLDERRRLRRVVGRWSRLAAQEFLAWLAVPDELANWLDVGCGTGELTRVILGAVAIHQP